MEIEKELTNEEVTQIINDPDLNSINIQQYYDTYYSSEVGDIAFKDSAKMTTCTTSIISK